MMLIKYLNGSPVPDEWELAYISYFHKKRKLLELQSNISDKYFNSVAWTNHKWRSWTRIWRARGRWAIRIQSWKNLYRPHTLSQTTYEKRSSTNQSAHINQSRKSIWHGTWHKILESTTRNLNFTLTKTFKTYMMYQDH